MRLKTFSDKTMNLAMDQVRAEFGDEAIIVSTFEDRKGVKITAALDHQKQQSIVTKQTKTSDKTKTMDTICKLLEFHQIPEKLSNTILEDVYSLADSVLEKGIESVINAISNFKPLDFKTTLSKKNPIMLVGPAGVGKSITAAKLAAEYRVHGQKVEIITTDSLKAGGIEQIKSFTTAMAIPLHIACSPDELDNIIDEIEQDTTIIIDTPGMNPLNAHEVDLLTELVLITKSPPVLVLSAGWDTTITQDMIEIYQMLGVNRLIHTRTDTVKRFGTLITAIWGSQLTLMHTSSGPTVGSRIENIDAEHVTQILTKCFLDDDESFVEEQDNDLHDDEPLNTTHDDNKAKQPLPWLAKSMESRR